MRILYIDIDSLRPDHLGCYGYHRNTSPHIDRIARDGIRFTNCYTPDAPCLPSRTAFYTGRFGIHTGVVGHSGTAADLRVEGRERGFKDWVEDQSLPSALQRAGFHTAQISPFGQRHAARQFYAGFNEIHNTGKNGYESAEEVTPSVMRWLEQNGRMDQWYLHLNYWDPHTPYRVPADHGEPFANDPLPEWITEDVLVAHQQAVGPHCAQEINMWNEDESRDRPRQPGAIRSSDDLRRMIDGYDTGVNYADHHFGKVLEWLDREGLYEDTAIIVSADHGENQGELGIYGEHGTADNITCRIPLIVKWPGKTNGVRDELIYNLDVAPTLMELLSRDAELAWDGTSFAPALFGDEFRGRPFVVLSQCAHVCQRSVRFGPWLYMRTYHDGFRLFPKEMLFNLVEDPHEQHDLALHHREICDEALRHLADWHDEMMSTMRYDNDPLWTVIQEGGPTHAKGKLPGYCERLQQTGRGWAVEELKKRHPREFNGAGSPPRS